MSFYSEASLAYVASAGAGKDGKAYSMKPVPEYGAELVTNGDFATDSDWTKGTGWSISGGVATHTGVQSLIGQENILTIGKTYKITFELSGANGSNYARLLTSQYPNGGNYTNDGIITVYTITNIDDVYIYGVGNISIDNVSVKEVLVADGDFTFSRGSNLAATRVGPTGLIEKGRENLLLQSNQFDTTWIQSGTLTSSQSGYDGSSDAWTFQNPTSTSSLYQPNTNSGVQTMSAYFKKNATYGVRFFAFGSSNANTYFNLDTGVVVQQNNTIAASIEPVGTDWFRCSMTFNQTNTRCDFYVTNNAQIQVLGDFTIQDAQVEIGLAATDYIESGATTGKAGLLEDEPRFDYSGGATCPSLLLEPSRTNLVVQSEYIGAWGPIGSPTITTNYGTSPEGIQNSTRLEGVAGDRIYLGISGASATYTYSIYAKGSGIIQLRDNSGSNYLDISLNSEWTRYDYSFTASFTNIQIQLNSATADAEIWGAQMEQGSYPTSYIPNHSGGTITRGAEGQSYSGFSSLIGQTEGTLFLEIDSAENGTEIFSLNRTTANAIFLTSSGNLYYVIIYSDGTLLNQFTSINISDRIKVAIAYQSNNFAVYANGSQIYTNNSTTWTPNVTIDSLNFNVGGYMASKNLARYKQVLLFKERLSNADLATLTTI